MSGSSKLWAGLYEGNTDSTADDFNSSLSFDSRMYAEDIEGSLAHAAMLCECGIIKKSDHDKIKEGLHQIKDDLDSGKLKFDFSFEDIHSFIETTLTSRIGESGKVLHTARSRNDQVALDIRLYLRKRIDAVIEKIDRLTDVIVCQAEKTLYFVAPGYTHLQRAQPISFAHQLLAYVYMLKRDKERFADCRKRLNVCPLGSCALAGTTYATDRIMTSEALGFDRPCENSIDGVSDRDFVIEAAFCASTLMMHLSRFSEEFILWASHEFKFASLDFRYSTGSSIMPQKKNPDMAELTRGKTGRVYGDLMALLTVMKGLPLAYNKDMQEDKEAVFDAFDTVIMCLDVFTPMLETTTFSADNMRKAASSGFINATDCADYLVKRGLEFRNAYKITGELVRYCTENGYTLEDLPIDEYKKFSSLFDEGVYTAVNLEECVKKRDSLGGAGFESVKKQIKDLKESK
ncbi:MAG: argininosuccinate lyase [Clostridia bacterium]|nr:argininosuccinate lyase [Clostridia bacterium]